MRRVTTLGAVALVGGLVALTAAHGLAPHGSQAPDTRVAEETPDVSPVEAAPETPAAAPIIIERAQVAAPHAAPPAPQQRPRSRSRRNRYPGPIPTPADWQPPEGPVRIGLQAGHWRANEAPRELRGLRDNGTAWQNVREWEANLAIAQSAGAMLEELGYVVDILPAVVPPSYRAHLFVAIHADGSNDPNARGYRVAGPSRDATGRAADMVDILQQKYGDATGLRSLPSTTRRMRNYYAFNFRRYEHALHPMTIGVILETGFITSPTDRRVILDAPEQAARGIVEAVRAFPVTASPDGAPEPDRPSRR